MESLDFSTIPFQGVIMSPQYVGGTSSKKSNNNTKKDNTKDNIIEIDKYFDKEFIKSYFAE